MPDLHVTTQPGNTVGIGPENMPPWLIVGPSVPADGAKGFPSGALMLVPTASGFIETWANVGDESSANFDPVTLIRKVTTTQRDAIASPIAGLLVYNTSTNKLNVRVAAAWEAVTSA